MLSNYYIKDYMLTNSQVRQEWQRATSEVAGILYDVIDSRSITIGDKTMRFQYFIRGDKPHDGYALVFGLHGGGGCPVQVNNQQFNNHLHLYDRQLPQGVIWFVPRSCEDVWDMWWQGYLEDFFTIIIRGFVFNQLVNPNKVFITGYSAGGDGVYHLAARMADWIAGAAMMAGHPNNAELYNMRNISFSIQVGGHDSAYERNDHARKYIQRMKEYKLKYGGFKTDYNQVHETCSHWMNLQDSCIFQNFFKESRNPYPDYILFKQHPRTKKNYFYYLQVNPNEHKQLITVKKDGNTFYIESEPIVINIYINHLMVDVNRVVEIYHNEKKTVCRLPVRRDEVIKKTIQERKDFWYIFQDYFVSDPKVDLRQKTIQANLGKMTQSTVKQNYEKEKACCDLY